MKSNGNSPKRSLRCTTSENLMDGGDFMEMNTTHRVSQSVSEDLRREDSDGESVGSQSGDDMKVEGTVASKPKRRAYVDPEVSKERRRERNKLLARKSRQKLKTDMDDLKMKLIYLMKENEYLKRQIEVSVVPPVNLQFLVQKDFALPDSITQLVKELMSRTQKALTPRKMKNSSFCISNAISKDMPLVYASPGFLKLTGYEMHEIIGHNCRFLQGPRTDRDTVNLIKKAMVEGRDITAVLLNYRKDGKPFWNQVKMAHLKDQSGRTFLVVGIQTKIRPLPPSQIQQQAQVQQQGLGQRQGQGQQRNNMQQQQHYQEEEEYSDDENDSEDEEEDRQPQQTQQRQEQRAMEMAMTGPPAPFPPNDVDACLLDGRFEFSFPPLQCDLSEMIRPSSHAAVGEEHLQYENSEQQQMQQMQMQGEEVLDAALVRAFDYFDPSPIPILVPSSLQQQAQPPPQIHLSQMQQQVVQDDHYALLRQSQSYYNNSGGGSHSSSNSSMRMGMATMAVGVRRGLGNSSCNDRIADLNHFTAPIPATPPMSSSNVDSESPEFEW